MVNGKVDTGDLEFEVIMADIEELNRKVLNEETDISKISFHAFAYAAEKYLLLNSGNAMGRGNGPLLIANHKTDPGEIKNLRIAIPGKHTTGNMLFSLEFPEAVNKKEYLFSDIEQAVLDNEVDAGVIIHENRFTYKQKGLKKIIDLGENWEKKTGNPVPLGGISAKRSIDKGILLQINQIIKSSIKFAFENPDSGYQFIRNNAQEMDPIIIKKHIGLYVNDYTIDLGEEGKNAIKDLYQIAFSKGITDSLPADIFLI
jgi:1,4-dihydroxy-6-naphthoate synthase